MSEAKWNMERVHKEVSDARTKIFVVAKVLETGDLKASEYPEWVILVRPLLEDLMKNAAAIRTLLEDEKTPPKKD